MVTISYKVGRKPDKMTTQSSEWNEPLNYVALWGTSIADSGKGKHSGLKLGDPYLLISSFIFKNLFFS